MIHTAGDDAQFTERHRLVLGPEPDVDGVGDVVHLAGALGGGHSDAARGVGGAVNQSTADRRVGVIATPDEQAGHVETVVRMKVRKQDRHPRPDRRIAATPQELPGRSRSRAAEFPVP